MTSSFRPIDAPRRPARLRLSSDLVARGVAEHAGYVAEFGSLPERIRQMPEEDDAAS